MSENVPSVALMFQSALPIDDIDQLILSANEGLILVWVDISEQPSLAVLGSQHEAKSGYSVCTWFYADPGRRTMKIGLRVEMRQPTRLTFHLVLKVEQYFNQLTTLAHYGRLWVVPGPPPTHLVGTQTMDFQELQAKVIDVCGQGVQLELQAHLVAELQHQLLLWTQRH